MSSLLNTHATSVLRSEGDSQDATESKRAQIRAWCEVLQVSTVVAVAQEWDITPKKDMTVSYLHHHIVCCVCQRPRVQLHHSSFEERKLQQAWQPLLVVVFNLRISLCTSFQVRGSLWLCPILMIESSTVTGYPPYWLWSCSHAKQSTRCEHLLLTVLVSAQNVKELMQMFGVVPLHESWFTTVLACCCHCYCVFIYF